MGGCFLGLLPFDSAMPSNLEINAMCHDLP
jgi:hypothetical protein